MESLDEVYNTVAVDSNLAISVASIEAYFDNKLHDLQMQADPCDMFSAQHQQIEIERQMLLQMFTEIMQLPRVEAQPVPAEMTAHWIDKTTWSYNNNIGDCQYQCSNCGFTNHSKPFSRGDGKGSKYCEECGCKMSTDIQKG